MRSKHSRGDTRQLVALVFLITQLLACVSAQVYYCYPRAGNYTDSSTYRSNLNTVFSSLYTNVNDSGFYHDSAGQNSSRVNALALCSGDAQLQTCRGCIRNATFILLDSCPNQKRAVVWHDICIVRYSDEPILGIMENSPGPVFFSTQNASRPLEFWADVISLLLGNLSNEAANGGSLRKVAARDITGPDSQTIFMLVQCSPDLSPRDCKTCLINATADLPRCCSRGGRVLTPSCVLRYEAYPFYNQTRLQELRAPPATPLTGSGDDNTTPAAVFIIVPLMVFFILVVLIVFLLRKRIKRKRMEELQSEVGEDISTVKSLQYDFSKIRAATNDFSDDKKLGRGGFGAVYRGRLNDGQEIAVKRLSKDSRQGDQEFKNEVLLLAKLQHKNLVRLLGFSMEGNEKVLVYELVQNGSLDQFIFDSTKKTYLNWDKRYKIIQGIARGLLYLHEDSRLKIIHRDLKASNILLDADMNPKIADFGTARLFDIDETHANTNRIVGTYGYMAPEYAMRGYFSIKSDVFSFGVLLLEILSGQRSNSFRNGEKIEDLLISAWKNWRQGTTANLIDPTLGVASGGPFDECRCIHIGLLCVQENASNRPTMASVVQMLNNFSINLPLPSEPHSLYSSIYDTDSTLLDESNSKGIESRKLSDSVCFSQIEASTTDLHSTSSASAPRNVYSLFSHGSALSLSLSLPPSLPPSWI